MFSTAGKCRFCEANLKAGFLLSETFAKLDGSPEAW